MRAARRQRLQACGRSASPTTPSPSSSAASSTASRSSRRSSCRGTAAASTCRCCNYRALIHGVTAARYWDWGDEDREFKFNNYLGRYHTRHLDLMDVLAMYQPRASAPLDAMARLCGFPGKLGMDGSEVAAAVARGRARRRAQLLRDRRREHASSLYQRFRLMRGELTAGEYAQEISLVRERIAAIGRAALEGIHRRVGRRVTGC